MLSGHHKVSIVHIRVGFDELSDITHLFVVVSHVFVSVKVVSGVTSPLVINFINTLRVQENQIDDNFFLCIAHGLTLKDS